MTNTKQSISLISLFLVAFSAWTPIASAGSLKEALGRGLSSPSSALTLNIAEGAGNSQAEMGQCFNLTLGGTLTVFLPETPDLGSTWYIREPVSMPGQAYDIVENYFTPTPGCGMPGCPGIRTIQLLAGLYAED